MSQLPPKSSPSGLLAAFSHALGREEEAEPVVEAVDQEDEGDAEGADDLDVDAELRHAAHHLGAGDVQAGLDREEEISVITRIVVWSVGSRFQPNQLWVSAVTYETTPVSTAATVISRASP